jgi:ankyrin repeat protein
VQCRGQVKDLLTEYSTINERDSSYWTPLHIACLIGGKGEKENRAQVPMLLPLAHTLGPEPQKQVGPEVVLSRW